MSQTNRRNCTEAFVVETVEEVKAQILDIIVVEINKSVDLLKTKIIDNLVKENKRLSSRVTLLEEENDQLYDRVLDVEVDLYDVQQRSRRNNLEISGVTNEILDENLESAIIEIINNMFEDDPITPSEIDAIHRLPSRGKTKPIIVRFTGRKRRDRVLERGREINNYDLKRVGIDNLSPYMKKHAYFWRKLCREKIIAKTKSEYGIIKIKIREDDHRWKKIMHKQDLMDIFPDYNFD